jgi:hypothetical protein
MRSRAVFVKKAVSGQLSAKPFGNALLSSEKLTSIARGFS